MLKDFGPCHCKQSVAGLKAVVVVAGGVAAAKAPRTEPALERCLELVDSAEPRKAEAF